MLNNLANLAASPDQDDDIITGGEGGYRKKRHYVDLKNKGKIYIRIANTDALVDHTHKNYGYFKVGVMNIPVKLRCPKGGKSDAFCPLCKNGWDLYNDAKADGRHESEDFKMKEDRRSKVGFSLAVYECFKNADGSFSYSDQGPQIIEHRYRYSQKDRGQVCPSYSDFKSFIQKNVAGPNNPIDIVAGEIIELTPVTTQSGKYVMTDYVHALAGAKIALPENHDEEMARFVTPSEWPFDFTVDQMELVIELAQAMAETALIPDQAERDAEIALINEAFCQIDNDKIRSLLELSVEIEARIAAEKEAEAANPTEPRSAPSTSTLKAAPAPAVQAPAKAPVKAPAKAPVKAAAEPTPAEASGTDPKAGKENLLAMLRKRDADRKSS